jgi:hypothetical protein
MKKEKKKHYKVRDLRIIADALNTVESSECHGGSPKLCVNSFKPFYSKNYYIDYSAKNKFQVYKKYKGWKP